MRADAPHPTGVGEYFAPHCDQSVLHAPGECRYCDQYPAWQHYRALAGIAFTGHQPVPLYDGGPMQAPCPSDYRRGPGQAHTWGGNRPTEIEAPQAETFESRVMYGHVGPERDPTRDLEAEAACWQAWSHGNPFRYCSMCTWRES